MAEELFGDYEVLTCSSVIFVIINMKDYLSFSHLSFEM